MLDENTKKYFENPKKVVEVKADEEFNLHLTFDNGEKKLYSMKDELEGVFVALRNKTKFQSAFVDEFGNVAWDINDSLDSTVYWENRIDICKDALYMNSVSDN